MENKIKLKSDILEVDEILKKTEAKLFKNLKVGSKIILFIDVKAPGRNKRTYASYITIKNIDTEETVQKSFNEVVKRLECFKFKS